MTHKELEAKVSAIMDKEPKHHHIWMGSDIYSNCRKCGEPDGTPKVCIPDPYTIPTERDAGREAYDLCLGQALMAFRELKLDYGKLCQVGVDCGLLVTRGSTGIRQMQEYVLNIATPAQIWSIVVKAKEQENER